MSSTISVPNWRVPPLFVLNANPSLEMAIITPDIAQRKALKSLRAHVLTPRRNPLPKPASLLLLVANLLLLSLILLLPSLCLLIHMVKLLKTFPKRSLLLWLFSTDSLRIPVILIKEVFHLPKILLPLDDMRRQRLNLVWEIQVLRELF